MAYIVTHDDRHSAAIDVGPGAGLTLEQALAHACRMISEGRPNVTIQDGKGRSISGAELVACCKSEKTLTADLRAAVPL
jgi:hypothetical protein